MFLRLYIIVEMEKKITIAEKKSSFKKKYKKINVRKYIMQKLILRKDQAIKVSDYLIITIKIKMI